MEYEPCMMVKGDAQTPERFWPYCYCDSQETEDRLRKFGYVKSNRNPVKPPTDIPH